MKKSTFGLAAFAGLALAMTVLTSASEAQPVPGGNPNCSVNWVGGACGLTINNGGVAGGPHVPVPCKKDRDSEECNCEHEA